MILKKFFLIFYYLLDYFICKYSPESKLFLEAYKTQIMSLQNSEVVFDQYIIVYQKMTLNIHVCLSTK